MNEPQSAKNQFPMINLTTVPMKTTLIAALFCTANLLLPAIA